jgi:hypothetical protein
VEQQDPVTSTPEEFAEKLVAHWELVQALQEDGCAFTRGIARLLLALAGMEEGEFVERVWTFEAGLHG